MRCKGAANVDKKREPKAISHAAKGKSGARRGRGQQQAPAAASDQMGATEKQVIPTTPPMAESDELPGRPVRKTRADDQISAADELTPG
jgi:hypothetical protein